MNNNTLKTCSKCRKEKPATLEYFGKASKNKDGLNAKCIPCYKEYMRTYNKKHYKENKGYYYTKNKKWQEENRERYNELTRNHYKRNKESELKRSKRYFEENPDYRKDYYIRNKEKHNKATLRWYKNNKQKHRKLMRRWYKNNKELVMALTYKYQHKKKQLPFDFNADDWRRALAYFDNACAYCGSKNTDLQKEHIVPVSKGGGFVRDNIIPSCGFCNRSKNNKDFEEWYKGKEYYSEERKSRILIFIDMNREHREA